jgi:hypothetical protein
MSIKLSLCVAFLVSAPAFSQVTSPVNPGPVSSDDRMSTPPPVSGEAYPTEVANEERSNYLSGGIGFQAAYIDNLNPGYGGSAISEKTYSILPTIELDQTRPRRHAAVTYSPGFTFYQPSSGLNEVDENLRVSYRVRMTPHSTFHLNDGFQDSSTSFSPAASVGGGAVYGSIATIAPGIIAPFAKRLTNVADGEFTLQTSRNAMVGASGTTTLVHYPNLSEVQGLYDSNQRGGTGFYDVRLSRRQYLGASYTYSYVVSTPANGNSETRSHAILGFFTFYPMERLPLSIAVGPQHYDVVQVSLPRIASWEPSISASGGWQANHTSFAANYTQGVTAGGGLLGAYRSKSTNGTARWQISSTWTAGLTATYAINKSVDPALFGDFQGGHSVSGEATAQHSIGRTLNLEFRYDRIHQSYGGIPALSINPDSNRVAASISWRFMRPLGQ